MKGFIEVHCAEDDNTYLVNVNYIKAVATKGPEAVIIIDDQVLPVKESYGKVVQLMQEAV